MTDTEADESGSRGSSSEDDKQLSSDEGVVESTGKAKGTKDRPRKARKGGLMRFLREVIAELRKVVYPTRQELMTYTAVVIVFVLIVMLFVSTLDYGIAKLMSWAFVG